MEKPFEPISLTPFIPKITSFLDKTRMKLNKGKIDEALGKKMGQKIILLKQQKISYQKLALSLRLLPQVVNVAPHSHCTSRI